jgi:predicted aldo/keto reductase-like oxidoreductase
MCYKNKCRCRGMFSFHDVPPNIMQAMKDEAITYDFINTAWNLLEGKNLTVRQREALDINKYFNGFRGPR